MPRVMIVDDESHMRELLKRAFVKEGYDVVSVPSAAQALELVFKEPFDAMLLDARLPGESGISVLKKVRGYQKKIPVVIYSGFLTPELEQEAREAGANEVFSKDLDASQLVTQIGRIIKAKDRIFQASVEPGKKILLVVDDEQGIRRILKEFFSRKGYVVLEAQNGEQAIELARAEKISAVLLDIRMPGMDGLKTLEKLMEIKPDLGVVMSTGVEDDEQIKKALELGAYSYVLKPYDFMYLELVVLSKLTIAESE